MKIKIDFFVIPMFILVILIDKVDIYLISTFLIIIHEIGHVIAAKIFGYNVMEFKIFALGAQASIIENNIKVGNKKNKIKRIVVDISGVLMNFLIIMLVLYLKENIYYSEIKNIEMQKTYLWFLKEWLDIIYINELIIFINLLPIYPLDGGRILKEILDITIGKEKSIYYIDEISRIGTYIIIFVLGIFIVYAKNILIFFFALFMLYLRHKERQMFEIRERVYLIIRKDEEEKIKYIENTCKTHRNVLK